MCLQSYCYSSSSTTIIIILATIVRLQLAGTKLVSSSPWSVCEGGSQRLCLSTQLEIESLSLYLQHFLQFCLSFLVAEKERLQYN